MFWFYIANNQDPLDIVYPNEDAILDKMTLWNSQL